MAAAQLAPIAANVAESVGAGAVQLASGIGASAHHQSDLEKKAEEARASAMDSDDSCNQLEVEVPGVIELRRSAAGAAEYRELQISRFLGSATMGAERQTVGSRRLIFSR